MRRKLLEYIASPANGTPLRLTVFSEEDGEVIDGVLTDANGHWYPIVKCVPRLVAPALRRGVLHAQWCSSHSAQLRELDICMDSIEKTASAQDELGDLKVRIAERFGFEWEEFSTFGWTDEQYNQQSARRAFVQKTGLTPNDLAGCLALDAGCGNGRYAWLAAEYGAEVIGVELFDEVDVAFENTRQNPKIHIVQADVFSLPFPNEVFDVVFSIGVLQHTGDAAGAFDSIAARVKPGGRFAVAVYGKGNPIYEFLMHSIRGRTTKMSIKGQMNFVGWFLKLTAAVKAMGLSRIAGRFLFVESHPHLLFNRYAVPVATHHTSDEVRAWYEQNGFSPSSPSMPEIRTCCRKWIKAAPSVRMVGEKERPL